MKIAIDTQTTLGQKTGFGFYVSNLLANLKSINKNNQYFSIHPEKNKDLSAPERFLWDQFGFPNKAKRYEPDILHQPCFSSPIFNRNTKIVLTVHDIIGITFSSDMPFFSRQYFGKWMPYSYKFANKIICDSENTKNDLMKILKIDEKKLKVIYLAANENFKPIKNNSAIEDTKARFGINGKYLLYLGTLNPRKNINLLVEIMPEIIKKFPDMKLVISGKKTWYYETIKNKVDSVGMERNVIFTDYISEKDANNLYNGAEIFLFPSLYEGFGLPPLEAMNCGVPVISSNASSLPEVMGNAGILLAPQDKKSWIKEIQNILSDSSLKREYSKKSLNQAKKFSWKNCAIETIKVYEEVYENSN